MDLDDTLRLSRLRQLAASGEARSLREGARLSLSEVAAAVGVDIGTLSKWERGLARPRGEAAFRYADLLDGLARAGAA